MLSVFRNMFRIRDLRNKVLFTLFIFGVYRLGAAIPVPGVSIDAVKQFADQAESAGDALMPSYTHMRRAMPVLVSHFLLSHAAALRRDHARLEHAREEADAAQVAPCPALR